MKNYIGKDTYGEYVFQKLDDNGIIKGFDIYYIVELVDGTMGLSQSSGTHEVKLDLGGHIYQSGMASAPNIDMPEEIANLYEVNTVSCEKCGAAHDAEEVYNPTFTIVEDCTVLCRDCVDVDDILVVLNDAEKLFKSKDIRDISLDGYEEIDVLFCDSSGLGSSGERALTKSQAIERAEHLINSYPDTELFSGITGMGQFQVYVSIFKKSA